jgi:hypothetical protein
MTPIFRNSLPVLIHLAKHILNLPDLERILTGKNKVTAVI